MSGGRGAFSVTRALWVSIRVVMDIALRVLRAAALVLAAWFVAAPVGAGPVRVDSVSVELVADRTAAVPGQPLKLGLRIQHDPEWHTYWRNPGDSGLPTRIDLSLPAGWKAGGIEWPAPQRIFVGPLANYGYDGDVLLPMPVTVPASPSGRVDLRAKASWLVCKEVCIPGEASLALDLPVAANAAPSAFAAQFERSARLAPASAIPVRAALSKTAVSLGLERDALARAEFFPYEDGLVRAPAPQVLRRIGDQGASSWRLDLELADGADVTAFEKAGFFGAAAGVVVLDGAAFEVRASRVASLPAGGTPVSTASGEELKRPGAGGQGVLDRLQASSAAAPPPEGLSLAIAAVFGALGGLLLNLMPCVFPVIGLKVLGFAGHASQHRHEARRNALAFAGGVLLSFWLLAGALLALRAAGQAVGWGFQLQSPPFVAAMALLFVLIGLNLAGVFEVGVRMTQLASYDPFASGRTGAAGAFGSGVLAVLVATPCSAPFMGSALGFTLGGSTVETLVVFSAIAAGMAVPYLALGYFPALLAWLPRPGRWMESFKQLLSFPMFATVAWLGWVLGQQAGVDAVLALSLGAVLVALAAWMYGRFVQSHAAVHRGLAGALAGIAFALGLFVAWPSESASPAAARPADGASAWQPWGDAELAAAVASGRPVFVDFTAAWCVSCQANKKLVLETDGVRERMRELGVVRMRADWTQRDARITAALARYGRNGVPLYLLYVPGEAAPRVLPEILTRGIVLEALAAIRG